MWFATVVAIVCLAAMVRVAQAQVVLNMPPPKPTANHRANPAENDSPDVGSLALQRYARARTGTYDNYGIDYRRRYYDDWWWDNNWFFGFPFFVGHHHHPGAPCKPSGMHVKAVFH